jgi:O-acetyl-ADP-ribose deacetylase (regulator of RNase III)
MAGSGSTQTRDVRFGRTALSIGVGELVDQPVEVLIAPGNMRGMFGAGANGTLWSAAGEMVERELRSHAPFEIGRAVTTESGRLAQRGVTHIVHAIVSPALGETPRPLDVPEAIGNAVDQVVDLRARSFALPIIGVSTRASEEQRLDAARVVLEAVVARLRTRKHRIERGILVSRFEDDRVPLESILDRARERLWTGS